MKKIITKPRGTKDILPDDQRYWSFIEKEVENQLLSFNFGKIVTPAFENIELFTKRGSVGDTSDIVQKEMFEVSRLVDTEDSESKEKFVLRPEATAPVLRSYLEKGMQVWPQPVKLYYFAPMYRYGRPQKGRYREFWQFGLEIIGDKDPQADIICLMLIWNIFNNLGLTKEDIIIDINSIGCKSCRPKINKNLKNYLLNYKDSLCENCKQRFEVNPLRVLDCKEEKCQKILEGAPQIIDSLCKTCNTDFKKVLEGLDELEIPYDLNPKLVRGLDYYTKTTFEIRDLEDKSRQSSLGGGGRYDNLMEILGGSQTPAIGFAGGIERIISKLKQKNIKIPEIIKTEIFVISLGDKAKKISLPLINSLNKKGFKTSCAMGKSSLKGQLKSASKSKAKLALIIGQREALDNSIIIKDLEDSTQESVPIDKLDEIIYSKLRKNNE